MLPCSHLSNSTLLLFFKHFITLHFTFLNVNIESTPLVTASDTQIHDAAAAMYRSFKSAKKKSVALLGYSNRQSPHISTEKAFD